jgi:hypothetical protein
MYIEATLQVVCNKVKLQVRTWQTIRHRNPDRNNGVQKNNVFQVYTEVKKVMYRVAYLPATN